MLADGAGRKITPEQFAENFESLVLLAMEERAQEWLDSAGIQNAVCPEHLRNPKNLTLILDPEDGKTLVPSYEECCPKLVTAVDCIVEKFVGEVKEEK
jgi:hypothetical protein